MHNCCNSKRRKDQTERNKAGIELTLESIHEQSTYDLMTTDWDLQLTWSFMTIDIDNNIYLLSTGIYDSIRELVTFFYWFSDRILVQVETA